MSSSNPIENSILLLSRLPGIGSRSARRIVFEFMKKKESLLEPTINSLESLFNNVTSCSVCFNLDVKNPCYICSNETRDNSCLCVVEDISSLWAIEKTKAYHGKYFVLGGTLSASRGNTPENLNIDTLINQISHANLSELIIALSPTIEGQITSNYITENVVTNIKISQLAQGIPAGGEIDYLDEITLSTAIRLRKKI